MSTQHPNPLRTVLNVWGFGASLEIMLGKGERQSRNLPLELTVVDTEETMGRLFETWRFVVSAILSVEKAGLVCTSGGS